MKRWPTYSSPFYDGLKSFFASRPGLWTLLPIAFCLAVLAVAFGSGCGARTILVPEAAPVRLGPDVRARVYTRVSGEWVLSDNRGPVQEGWYLVPPSFVEE